MALDIYTGSMTRYYAHQWKTETAQWAEQNGVPYARIDTSEKSDAVTDPMKIHEIVVDWMATTSKRPALLEGGVVLSWDESVDSPYATEKIDWQWLNALKLVAAYHEHGDLQRPVLLRDDFASDPALARSMSKGFQTPYGPIYFPELWLPVELGMVLETVTPGESLVDFGSSVDLLTALKILNEELFEASEEEIERWGREDGTAVEGTLEYFAKCGFSVLCRHAQISIERRHPILLDY
jgi:hypothetical protein